MTIFEGNLGIGPDLELYRDSGSKFDTIDLSALRREDIERAWRGGSGNMLCSPSWEFLNSPEANAVIIHTEGWAFVPKFIIAYPDGRPKSVEFAVFRSDGDKSPRLLDQVGQWYESAEHSNIILPKWMKYMARNLCRRPR